MIKKIKTTKKNRIITIAVFSSIAVGLIIIVMGMSYYKYRVSELGLLNSADYKKYKYHYAMISKATDEALWDAIYQSALEKADEHDIYIEKMGSNISADYSLEDMMKIAIASKVDGIILEPEDNDNLLKLINEADEAKIPVVTFIKDIPLSKRKSYVGINTYNQGKVYADQVLALANKGRKRITVLMNSDEINIGQSAIYSSILNAVRGKDIQINYATFNIQNAFSSKEDIRDLIMYSLNPPDVLICLSAENTISAYQTIVDYNRVGYVDILGYYASDIILQAIEKNIIYSTITIDTKQMGTYCTEALYEYQKTGYVSDYYSVDINVINKDNVQEFKNNSDITTQ